MNYWYRCRDRHSDCKAKEIKCKRAEIRKKTTSSRCVRVDQNPEYRSMHIQFVTRFLVYNETIKVSGTFLSQVRPGLSNVGSMQPSYGYVSRSPVVQQHFTDVDRFRTNSTPEDRRSSTLRMLRLYAFVSMLPATVRGCRGEGAFKLISKQDEFRTMTIDHQSLRPIMK